MAGREGPFVLCATPETVEASVPKLKRLWKARNCLESKLRQQRARLKREGIITEAYGTEDSSSGDDDEAEHVV